MGRVTKLPLRYVNEYRDVRGKLRRYFRRPGHKRIPLPGLPGSDEFMSAYQAAVAGVAAPLGINRTKPGTVNAAIVGYYQFPPSPSSRQAPGLSAGTYLNDFESNTATTVSPCSSNDTSLSS